jgi:methyl-accepting chemotaxis protein
LPVEEVRSAADIVKELASQIEQIMADIDDGLQRLKAAGKSDDILVQTCRKLIARAQETLSDPEASGFTVRRLEMTRNSLTTTLRQVSSRLKA